MIKRNQEAMVKLKLLLKKVEKESTPESEAVGHAIADDLWGYLTNFVFWICPKGCKGLVEWNKECTRATCLKCGEVSYKFPKGTWR